MAAQRISTVGSSHAIGVGGIVFGEHGDAILAPFVSQSLDAPVGDQRALVGVGVVRQGNGGFHVLASGCNDGYILYAAVYRIAGVFGMPQGILFLAHIGAVGCLDAVETLDAGVQNVDRTCGCDALPAGNQLNDGPVCADPRALFQGDASGESLFPGKRAVVRQQFL